jgi:hypothetical protein
MVGRLKAAGSTGQHRASNDHHPSFRRDLDRLIQAGAALFIDKEQDQTIRKGIGDHLFRPGRINPLCLWMIRDARTSDVELGLQFFQGKREDAPSLLLPLNCVPDLNSHQPLQQ